MFDLSYFNLGFRSDSVSNLLKELKSKEVEKDNILADAFSIISDCLKIKDENVLISHLLPSKGYAMNRLLPLLAELYVGKKLEDIVSDLNNIYEILGKARSNHREVKQKEYDHVVGFFSDLADLCLSNSANQSFQEKHSFI